jgi:dienelactone hydrolase
MSDVAALQRKPARLPDDTVYPRPIEPGQSVEDWIRRRDAILRRWTDILGGFPGTCDLAPEILSELEQPTHLRRKVRYRVETIGGGIWVEAFLLVPKAGHSAGPTSRQAERQYSAGYDRAACPAVVVFHPTTHDTIGEPVGLAGFPARHSALHLVERGYVVLVPRNFLWDYRGRSLAVDGAEAVAQAMLAEHPGWTGMAKMVWDGMRAVDYLQTLECVDHDRIGCFGFSLGGKEALYLPALDPRVKAAVSIDGGIGLRYSNWDALFVR